MLTAYITRGLPASGKSTWALEKLKTNPGGIKRVNRDLLREMLDGGHWPKGNEKFILEIREEVIWQSLINGKHVIVDDTNLNPEHIKRIRALVNRWKRQLGLEAKIEIVDFTDVGVDECIKRDSKRPNYVGEKVIREMYNKWLKPLEYKEPKKAEQDESLPHAIICDLDGTLALLNGRDPYDASTCENDILNQPVHNILCQSDVRHILFVSGRSDRYKEKTWDWIAENVKAGENQYLFMRKEGDCRKDSVVKKEFLDNEIKGKYYIDFILDDRDQVVQMWRDEGYTCLQVSNGDF